ncbi:asparagine synthase-related protein [Vibrio rotiferianus]|uniref:asparagine synthase-related protein n=1 Tax=Vibrio rotiferianus TaxID=190895 RepID=UPI002894373D|nr:putative Asparagine synthase [Vibrio rotiferianus]
MPGFSCFIKQPFAEECNQHLLGDRVHSFSDEGIVGQLNAIRVNVGNHYCETRHVCAYLHGDIFSGLGASDALNALILAYESNSLPQALAKANGYFAFMLYDKRSNKAYFATDRYGMKPVYFWKQGEQLMAVANELKSLAVHPNFELSPNESAIDAFTGLGQMLENQTWFEACERLGPSCLLSVDCDDQTYHIDHYWSWKSVTKTDKITFDDATDKLYELYVQAIERCLRSVNSSTLAITLSGGLDSRVLLAEAVKQFKGTIETFTFGIEGCEDSVIAKQVSDIAGVRNHFRPIDKDNWFTGRENGVWTSEGMFNIVHMHTLASVQNICDFSPYLLNGYCGDAVIGGSYLLGNALNQAPSIQSLNSKYGEYAKYIDLTNPYYDCTCTDPAMVVSNRGIRFVASGSDLLADRLHNLKPFMDVDLLDFVYSLPDEYRYKSRLYNAMLLKYYPEYFASIPWQNTGKVISVDWSNDEAIEKKPNLKQKLIEIVKKTPLESLARQVYQRFCDNKKNYVSYPSWMRDEHFINYMLEKFSPPWLVESTLFVQTELPCEALERFTVDHKMRPEKVGGWLTLALYLEALSQARQQVKSKIV